MPVQCVVFYVLLMIAVKSQEPERNQEAQDSFSESDIGEAQLPFSTMFEKNFDEADAERDLEGKIPKVAGVSKKTMEASKGAFIEDTFKIITTKLKKKTIKAEEILAPPKGPTTSAVKPADPAVTKYVKSWDPDDDGLDLDEWNAFISDVYSATPPTPEQMFKALDADGGGSLSYQEAGKVFKNFKEAAGGNKEMDLKQFKEALKKKEKNSKKKKPKKPTSKALKETLKLHVQNFIWNSLGEKSPRGDIQLKIANLIGPDRKEPLKSELLKLYTAMITKPHPDRITNPYSDACGWMSIFAGFTESQPVSKQTVCKGFDKDGDGILSLKEIETSGYADFPKKEMGGKESITIAECAQILNGGTLKGPKTTTKGVQTKKKEEKEEEEKDEKEEKEQSVDNVPAPPCPHTKDALSNIEADITIHVKASPDLDGKKKEDDVEGGEEDGGGAEDEGGSGEEGGDNEEKPEAWNTLISV